MNSYPPLTRLQARSLYMQSSCTSRTGGRAGPHQLSLSRQAPGEPDRWIDDVDGFTSTGTLAVVVVKRVSSGCVDRFDRVRGGSLFRLPPRMRRQWIDRSRRRGRGVISFSPREKEQPKKKREREKKKEKSLNERGGGGGKN